jgi:hypothetical protein
MEVVPARAVLRWYSVRFPGDHWKTEVFAERFFDSREEADQYAGRRAVEIAPRRVPHPMPIREDESIWAVCVEIA